MKTNYAHQQKILDDDPKKTGLFLGTGSGKTRIALMLARGNTLVICPKTQKEDRNWEREFDSLLPPAKAGVKVNQLLTITFDIFKRDAATLPRFDTVIVDEAHGMLGLTPATRMRKRVEIPKSSQRFEALQEYLERTKPDRLYLCTATIVKSPMTVYAAKMLLEGAGDMADFFRFRQRFYTRLPMPGREVWAPRKDSACKDDLASLVRSIGYVGRLEDYFDVPEQTFITKHIELTEKQKARLKELPVIYPEPIVRVGKRHQVENGVLIGDEFTATEHFDNGKIDAILDYAAEFPRMVVFVKYTPQIEDIAAALRKGGYRVWELTGASPNRKTVLDEAKAMDGILVAQAQISAGWELPDTPVMIFASRTYSYVDYAQGIGRILRANRLKKNLYINLVVPKSVDEAVDNSLTHKQDFDERIYAEQE